MCLTDIGGKYLSDSLRFVYGTCISTGFVWDISCLEIDSKDRLIETSACVCTAEHKIVSNCCVIPDFTELQSKMHQICQN